MRLTDRVVLVGAALALLPVAGMAQMDPGMNGAGTMQSGDVYRAPGTLPSSGGPTSQTTSMRDSLGAPGQNGQAILDKQFLRTATESNLADVQIGTLATQKGSPDVKVLAQKIVDDHTQLNKDMGSVADSMGVLVPKKLSKDQQAEYEKLNGLSGKDFDTEYVTYLAKTHFQDLHAYRMEASVAVDPGLQSEVMKSLGTMRDHLSLIGKTATAEGIALPKPPARPNATSASNAGH